MLKFYSTSRTAGKIAEIQNKIELMKREIAGLHYPGGSFAGEYLTRNLYASIVDLDILKDLREKARHEWNEP